MNNEHNGYRSHRDYRGYSGYRGHRDECRRDDEMYVYDQCCGNCALHGSETCPMFLDEEEASKMVIKRVEQQRKEDAVIREGEPQWCIYWQQGNHHGHHGHHKQGNQHSYHERYGCEWEGC